MGRLVGAEAVAWCWDIPGAGAVQGGDCVGGWEQMEGVQVRPGVVARLGSLWSPQHP